MTTNPQRDLILGSSSRYRAELLSRLSLPFQTQIPDIDESPLAHETPRDLAKRLSYQKAYAIAQRYPEAVIIGSDQVPDCQGQPLAKPMTHSRAVEQLLFLQGQSVAFHTAVTVLCLATGFEATAINSPQVQYRPLDSSTIERYLASEPAYDCAGAAKSEGLGIVLFERIESDDPTALIGLPLIATSQLLQQAGILLF